MFNEDALKTGINEAPIQEPELELPEVDVPSEGVQLDLDEVPTADQVEAPAPTQGLAALKTPRNYSSSVLQTDNDLQHGRLNAVASTARQWATTKIAKGIYQDGLMDRVAKFGEPDPDFNMETALGERGVRLSDREHKWMVDRGIHNEAEMDYFLNEIEQQRSDNTMMGRYPGTAFGAGAVDPIYWAGGAYGVAVGRVFGASRLGSAAIAGTVDAGIGFAEMHYNPSIEIGDVAGNAILGFAMGGAFHSNAPTKSRFNESVEEGVETHAVAREPQRIYDTSKELVLEDIPKPDTTVPMTKAEELANLREILRENTGGYLDESGNIVPEVSQGYHLTGVLDEFSEPTVSIKPEYEFKADPYGEGIAINRGEYRFDTPEGMTIVDAIRTETKARNNDRMGFEDWNFLKDGWEGNVTSEVGLPHYKDINWKAVNEDGTPLRRTAFHAIMQRLDDPKLDPIIRRELEYQVLMDSRSLIETTYSARRLDPPNKSTRVVGYYSVTKRHIQHRKYKDLSQARWDGTLAHEAMHALTATKIEYGLRNPNTMHGKLVKELLDIQQVIRDAISKTHRAEFDKLDSDTQFALRYSVSSPHELFTSIAQNSKETSPFLKFLESIEAPHVKGVDPKASGRNLLERIVDNIRKLLGLDVARGNALMKALGIRDDIIKAPRIAIRDLKGRQRDIKLTNRMFSKELVEASIKEAEVVAEAASQTFGKKIAWNAFKTVEKLSPSFAKMFLSDPLGSNPRNIQSVKQAIRTDFIDKYQVPMNRTIEAEMRERGIKFYDPILNPDKTREVEHAISREVTEVLTHMERGSYGTRDLGFNENIIKIAETHAAFTKDAAKRLVDAGLLEPKALEKNGYFPRRADGHAINEILDSIEGMFKDRSAAVAHLGKELGKNLRYPDLDSKQRFILGRAWVQRALRQADNTDLIYRGHMGMDAAYEIRQMLENIGTDPKDVNRILDVVTGKISEAGKDSWQKHRMDIDMGGVMVLPDGTHIMVHDMLDKIHLFQNTTRYMEDISGRLAMAEHGIKDSVDLDKLRKSFIDEAAAHNKKGKLTPDEATEMFEDIVDNTLGRATGRELHPIARITQGFTQMMALRNSGFWQVTELAKIMAQDIAANGFADSFKRLNRAFKDFKSVENPEVARNLTQILSRKSWNEVRMRPFVDRYVDGHAVKGGFYTVMEKAKSSVYVLNGMTTVQRIQANYAADLLVTSLSDAARGNTKLRNYFKRYGLGDDILERVKVEMDIHGLAVDSWDHVVWDAINPALTEIMDTSVLRSKLGEVPLFFQFSEAGRVLGTFQNFTLTAHNKIFANTVANEGVKAFAAMVALQLPLALLMTQASSVSAGRGFITEEGKWVAAALGQMGSFGLAVEIFNMVSGNSQGVGGAFTISADRAMSSASKFLQGDVLGGIESTARNAPLLSLLPGWGLGISTIKELWNTSTDLVFGDEEE